MNFIQSIIIIIMLSILFFIMKDSHDLTKECKAKCLPNAVSSIRPNCVCDLTKVIK